MKLRAPQGVQISWSGAVEISRTATESLAICDLWSTGELRVSVEAIGPAYGRTIHECTFEVVEIDPADVWIEPITIEATEIDLGSTTVRRDLVRRFMSSSVASLVDLGGHRYLTSVNRRLTARTSVHPSSFAPLIEWRVDGDAKAIGSQATLNIPEPGLHSVDAGPIDRPELATIETYKVRIRGRGQRILDGEAITYEAETEPPGYEDRVTWMASSRWGSVSPVAGRGRFFTVTFSGFTGPSGAQWLGVRGDNAVVALDGKGFVLGSCATTVSRGNDDNKECLYETARIRVGLRIVKKNGVGNLTLSYRSVHTGNPADGQFAMIGTQLLLDEVGQDNDSANLLHVPCGPPAEQFKDDKLTANLSLRSTVAPNDMLHTGTIQVRTRTQDPANDVKIQTITYSVQIKPNCELSRCEVNIVEHPSRELVGVDGLPLPTPCLTTHPLRSVATPYPPFPGVGRLTTTDCATWPVGTTCSADGRAVPPPGQTVRCSSSIQLPRPVDP